MPAVEVAFAFILGISIAAPPGPINVMMFSETLRKGQKHALLIGLGATTADALFYALTSIFGKAVPDHGLWHLALYAFGAAVLLYMAFSVLRTSELEASLNPPLQVSGYFKGLSVGLTNPLQIGWWVTVGLPLISLFGYGYFAVGFFAGIFTWVYSFTRAVSLYRDRVAGRLSIIVKASSSVLFAFAVYFAYRALSQL